MNKEDLITTNEAAVFIGVTTDSIGNYRRRGWLHAIRRANGRILLLREEVERLREELLAKRHPIDNPKLVQASKAIRESWRKQSLRTDPDRIMFDSEVWQALSQYEEAKRAR